MKILVAGHSIAHYRQRVMWEWMASQGHKVLSLCIPQYSTDKYEPKKTGSYELALVNSYQSQIPNMWFFPQMMDIAHQFEPDLMFCVQEPITQFAYHMLNVAEALRVPFGYFTWENIRKVYPNPWRRFFSKVVSNADLAICGNGDAARLIEEAGAPFATTEIQTGLDVGMFVPEPKLNFTGSEQPLNLLFVGRLTEEKGVNVILQAFDRMENKNANLKFVGGRGPMEEVIKVHPEYKRRITLEPWKEYTQLPKVYNWADLLLVPSIDTLQWREQCGYVIGEALLCHVPVVTTISKSIVEIWKNDDVSFISQNDVGMLVDFLDEFKKREAKKGREFVKEVYSVEAVGQRYLNLFEDLV